MTKTRRRSLIGWDNETILASTKLYLDEPDYFFNQFHFWTLETNWKYCAKNKRFIHEVIIPKKILRNISTRTIVKLNQEVRELIANQFPHSKY